MKTDWLNESVIQISILAALLGIGLIGSITLWVFAKIDARASRKEFQVFRLSTETAISDLVARIEALQSVPVSEPIPSPLMTVQGMNLTTRTKVLRMHRRGETIPSIAAALGAQHEEVELLLKLDRLLETPAA
jgi:hypothetical protein